jgi:branched-chain amino acid aminotransferase
MAKNRVANTDHQTIQLYEVIRIIEGIPVFLEDHLDRLYQSARLTGMNLLPDPFSLAGKIKKYVTSQKQETGNIKLSFSFKNRTSEPRFELKFIPHYYPTPEEYANGVKVGLMHADRPIPQAKIQHADITDRVNRIILDSSLFEVLLVDSEGNITEGSRSNVFFIKNETLFSPPGKKVLQGITRIKVLQICEKTGIRVIESAIPANTTDQYEAAFLTGTSPKILSISSVEQVVYMRDHPLIIKLQNLYNQLIDDYLLGKR